MANKTYITDSKEETQEIAKNFVKKISGGDIVTLYGNLGSGKTTFVQGLARGFGIKKRIISPTFIIVRTYKLKTSRPRQAKRGGQNSRVKNTNQNSKLFYHVDLYRAESEKEVQGLGIEEIVNSKDIVAIEWAEKMQNLLPKRRWDVKFEDLGGSRRKIIINQKL